MSQTDTALLERVSSVPSQKLMSRDELIEFIAARVERRPKLCFRALYSIERYNDDEEYLIRDLNTTGTAFEPVREALNKAGRPTDDTVGGIMDALPITRLEVEALICDCHGETITGAALATRLRALLS